MRPTTQEADYENDLNRVDTLAALIERASNPHPAGRMVCWPEVVDVPPLG